MSDLTSMDFFRDVDKLIDDPYPYFEGPRTKCPVLREEHRGVTMVTGWQEAVDIYNDAQAFSSCISVTGPFSGIPVPHALLMRLTTPKRLKENGDAMWQIADLLGESSEDREKLIERLDRAAPTEGAR